MGSNARSRAPGGSAMIEFGLHPDDTRAVRPEIAGGWRYGPRFVLRSPGFPVDLLDPMRKVRTCAALDRGAAVDGPELGAIYADECAAEQQALADLIARPDIQQALYLSSADAYRNVLPKVRRALDRGRFNSDSRRALRTLFTYLQRLTIKNETTSFFGPLNYGCVDDRDPEAFRLSVTQGASSGAMGTALTQERGVFLTFWAVTALADAIAADPDIAGHVPLFRHPMVQLHAHGMRLPDGRDRRIPDAVRTVLQQVDGRRSRDDLTRALGPAAARIVDKLAETGVIRYGPLVGSSRLPLLADLRADLAGLPASAGRERWLARLDRWADWCRAMEDADFAARLDLMAEAEARFADETGLPARRGTGAIYEDRTIFYEEARGAVSECTIGSGLHADLVARTAPVLDLAAAEGLHQWQDLQARARRVFDRLSPDGDPVPAAAFLDAMRAQLPERPEPGLSPVGRQLRRQVAHAAEDGREEVAIDPAQLDIEPVAGARYALLDLFLSARDSAAIERGAYDVFVGKMHHHLLLPSWLTTFMPDGADYPAQLRAQLQDVGLGGLVALQVRRRNKGFYAFPGPRIAYADPVAPRDIDEGIEALTLGEMQVARGEDGGVALMHEGRARPLYLTLTDHQNYAPFAALAHPWLAPPQIDLGAYTPRIRVGGCIMQRRRWRLQAGDVARRLSGSGPALLQAGLALRRDHALPERLFAKSDAERKPVFVDFTQDLGLTVLARLAASGTVLRLEEAFPDRDGLWLHQGGHPYSAELRIAALRPAVPVGAPDHDSRGSQGA